MPLSPFTNSEMAPRFEYGASVLYECRTTGYLTAHPQPSQNEITSYYQPDYYRGNRYKCKPIEVGSQESKTWNRRLEKIESLRQTSFSPSDSSLLDIGAGTGAFCEVASKKGWEVSCVELSAHGRSAIAQRIPDVHRIVDRLNPEQWGPNQFDLITLWAVIEHMPYDPVFLRSLFHLLKPSGMIALSFPNPRTANRYLFKQHWRYFIPIEHLTFFPPKLFKTLVTDAGFIVLSEESFYSRQAFFDGLAKTSVTNLPRRIAKLISRVVEVSTRPFLHGDTYEIYALKL